MQLYDNDLEFTTRYHALGAGKQVTKFHLKDALLCYLGHLCVPSRKHTKIILETHYRKVERNLGVDNIVVLIHKYLYWKFFY
jgi:hypothetical protein